MIIEDAPIKGLKIVQRNQILDERGFFERFFCADELHEILGGKNILQMNRSFTKKKGSVRGMHFQTAPKQEIKIITCTKGCVFDVAVDLRKDSTTFLKWHAQILDAEKGETFIIPEGFAHGFQTLTNDCEMIYLHTCEYSSKYEKAINPFDPAVDINWPLKLADISKKDLSHTMIGPDYEGI